MPDFTYVSPTDEDQFWALVDTENRDRETLAVNASPDS